MVGGVEDDEVTLIVGQVVHFAAQQAGADGVERAHIEALRAAVEQLLDAVFHLTRRLVCKGHGHDVPGRDAHLLDEVGDAVGQNARFAAAGAGDDQQRAGRGADGVALGGVESCQQIHAPILILPINSSHFRARIVYTRVNINGPLPVVTTL